MFKNFVKLTLLHEYLNLHCGKWKIFLTKNISSNHIIGIISLTIALFSRNFCYKSVSVNFRNSQCSVINLISRFCRKICKTSLISQIFGIFLYSSNLSFSKNWKVWYSWRRLGISSTEPRYFSQEIKKELKNYSQWEFH